MENVILSIINNSVKLKQKFGLARLGVFGSQVQGSASSDSDLDILFEPMPGKSFTFKEYIQLENELKAITGLDKVDLVNAKYVNPFVAASAEKSIKYV
jgi:predicted nucleotidyltransferase